jgi:hypothetical protein
MSFTKDLRGTAKLGVGIYRLLGFAPKKEFDKEDYADFLINIGFEGCKIKQIDGKIPMCVAVWRK